MIRKMKRRLETHGYLSSELTTSQLLNSSNNKHVDTSCIMFKVLFMRTNDYQYTSLIIPILDMSVANEIKKQLI